MSTSFRRLRFRVKADAQDHFIAECWQAVTLGVAVVEEGSEDAVLEAWFDEDAPPARLAVLNSFVGAQMISEDAVVAADWMKPYRDAVAPRALGRFLIDARELEASAPEPDVVDGLFRLRIPARQAFGTGSHATTQLMLERLLASPPEGLRVLDVGTGTGVLSYAAWNLDAVRVIGFDYDFEAATAAQLVMSANHHLGAARSIPAANPAPSFFAGTVQALRSPPHDSSSLYDLALVNVLPERIAQDVPLICGLLERSATVWVSGIVDGEEQRALEPWQAVGWSSVAGFQIDDWRLQVLTFERGEM